MNFSPYRNSQYCEKPNYQPSFALYKNAEIIVNLRLNKNSQCYLKVKNKKEKLDLILKEAEKNKEIQNPNHEKLMKFYSPFGDVWFFESIPGV